MVGKVCEMMNEELFTLARMQAEIYNIFSNEKRLLILWLLDDAEMSVNEITEFLQTSVQNTSQHLRLMKSKGILSSRRDGQTIYYTIADTELGRYCRSIHKDNLTRLTDEEISIIIH